MDNLKELINRIEKLEKDDNFNKLNQKLSKFEEKINKVENEVKHLKAVLQYNLRNKIK